jgi:Domain of unknown function (DUF4249)
MKCRERYDPPVTSLSNSFLVVEGVLNAGQDSTTIHLTRTFKLDQDSTLRTEDNAQLTVEGKDNTTSFLSGAGKGKYVSGNLNLIPGNEYRLRIKTIDGKEYLSDYVTAKITPPIDSVNWDRNNAGVQIYVNSKDPSNATRYYRWEYEETWEIHAYYFSDVIYENSSNTIRQRQFPAEDVSKGWKYENSSSILLANSIRLQNDIIYRAPLKLIAPGAERLSVRYSILVRQYALEEQAYNFFDLMKKNTEDIGSLFNPQPSEIKGNIHCISDPGEYVVGYVTASTIETKRIFISQDQVPQWGYIEEFCKTDTVPNNPDSIRFYFGSGGLIPWLFHNPPGDYYLGAEPQCVDCTVRGASTIKPVYW